MSKLGEVFTQTVNEIDGSLNARLQEQRQELKVNYLKSLPKMDVKQALIEEKKKQIANLQEEVRKLENEIKNLDPCLTSEEASQLFKELGGEGNPNYWGSKTKSEVVVEATLSKTNAYKNKQAWAKIHAQVKGQFNLCITEKQRQGIVLGLQNGVDWKGLGINIPNLFDLRTVRVKNGAILIGNALPNKTKK